MNRAFKSIQKHYNSIMKGLIKFSLILERPIIAAAPVHMCVFVLFVFICICVCACECVCENIVWFVRYADFILAADLF